MELLTVHEAAVILGLSDARVYQLVESGTLEAEKAGRTWLVYAASVRDRAENPAKPGRPPQEKAPRMQRYTLMNRAHEILDFEYDAENRAFHETTAIYDAARTPLGLVSPRGKRVSATALAYWWKHRAIPRGRNGVSAKLKELQLQLPFEIPFRSFGLSLSDQYWIRPEGTDIAWKDINFFDNQFDDSRVGSGWLDFVGLESPDNTSEGQLPKQWIVRAGKRVLLKGGSVLNQEPYNEVAATKLYERLLSPGEYVPYQLRSIAGVAVSACEAFVTSEEEYIPAYYVKQVMRQPNHHNDYQHYLECCAKLGVDNAERALAKMIVCDDIVGNADRHWRNFGLVRNVETLECRVAPLFDAGNSLWASAPFDQLAAGDFSFTTKPFYEDANRQLRLVNDYSWFNLDALEGFSEQVQDILAENSVLADRAPLVRKAVQKRIDRIVYLL